MNTEKAVIDHYTRGDMAELVLAEVRKVAADPKNMTVSELGAHDEFHIGGRRATEYFMGKLKLAKDMKVLDIGSGIGGAARFVVHAYGAKVSGVDLTPEFVETARVLNDAVGMKGNPVFETASALALPFNDGSFDMAYTIHTAMNIKDKAGMYREAARALKTGAIFGIYDIMTGDKGGALEFPVPWSTHPETSFLATPDEVKTMLEKAGFEITHSESRRDFALEAFKIRQGEKLPVYRQPDFALKVANLTKNVEAGRCAPHIIICRKM